MATRGDLVDWVIQAVAALGGEAKVAAIAKYIWDSHQYDLEKSGDLFFTWQYDMRWAANKLRRAGKLASPEATKRGHWALAKAGHN